MSAAAVADDKTHITFADCTDCPKMVVIPAGEFMMGSPQNELGRSEDSRNEDEDDTPGPGGNQVHVTVPRFAFGVYEITHGQFRAFMAATHYKVPQGCMAILPPSKQVQWEPTANWANKGRPNIDNQAAGCIDWDMAVAYTKWMSAKTGKHYRLPSEAEFEYALRAGSATRYHFGDNQEDLCLYGNVPDASLRVYAPWFHTTECSDGVPFWGPVGQFRPNAFGLYDMTGDAWEWIEDCYQPSYARTPRDGKPLEMDNCASRSIRGGSMGYDLPSLRSADRSDDPPKTLFDGIDFRVARDLAPDEYLDAKP
ncbi:MAG TPA: SUMF1/EgtB/PvdO family nonheme iron enzyme [Rhizomicrobium sp.]|nr:SUMF1/EgtB/PvdO family nonheme iron enzyme [Rhizomicrobium sp.]